MAEKSAYEAIASALVRDIEEGRLRPGDRLPSEAALREQYGVTPTTVRRALRELEIAGVTRGEVGRGVFVRSYERTPVEAMLTSGRQEGPGLVEVAIMQPPAQVAALMPGATSVVRRSSAATPMVASYYARHLVALVPELGEPAALPEPDDVLLGRAGVELVGRQVEVVSRMPTRQETAALGVPAGTPLLEYVVELVDRDGAVQVVREGLYPGDRYKLRLTLG
ncbi:GntR family transcriptional regulator [Nonomuraea sp. NPDC003214]